MDSVNRMVALDLSHQTTLALFKLDPNARIVLISAKKDKGRSASINSHGFIILQSFVH